MLKVGYQYDETGSIQGSDAPVQHDNTNYSASLVAGRGSVSSVTRHDVVNASQSTTSTIKYNTAGAVVATLDPLSHGVTISYTNQFSANGTDLDSALGFSTLAYPTTVTMPAALRQQLVTTMPLAGLPESKRRCRMLPTTSQARCKSSSTTLSAG
jgi:hypothetical protein